MDELETKYYLQYKQNFPLLAEAVVKKMAIDKAIWERDTERLASEDVRSLIQKLSLPTVILDLFNETATAETSELNDDFRCPEEFFLMTKKEQDNYEVDQIKPLLSDLDFYTIYAYDTANQSYLIYDIEESIPQERLKWEGLFIYCILKWVDDEEDEITIIKRAKSLGITSIEKILALVNSTLNTHPEIELGELKEKILSDLDLKVRF